MKNILLLGAITLGTILSSCKQEEPVQSELDKVIEDWGYILPLPSDNDTINLLHILAEKNWFMYNHKVSDSICDVILSIDSTFHPAISFKAWDPLNLELLDLALHYAKKDTTVHRTILVADYAYWINKDTATAIKLFKEVYDKYPDCKVTNWCLGMAYLWAGQADKAIKYYKHALDLYPKFPKSYGMMGWAYYIKEDFTEAARNWEQSIEMGNQDLYTFRYLGNAYEKLGSSNKANHYYHLADSLEKK